jgi:ribosome-associated heat shock protein Hsp15
MRIDKWLWAARFFKTRSAAQKAIEGGKVKANGERLKASKELRAGDELTVTIGTADWVIKVVELSDKRGPATVARGLYAEDESSKKVREDRAALKRAYREPAAERHGRPTKRQRRVLDRFTSER